MSDENIQKLALLAFKRRYGDRGANIDPGNEYLSGLADGMNIMRQLYQDTHPECPVNRELPLGENGFL